MALGIRDLARHSAIYGFGSALRAAGSFLLIPIYTHALSTAGFGILEILNRVADIILIVMFLGLRQAYIRFFFDQADEEWQKRVTTTFMIFAVIMATTVAGAFFHFRIPIAVAIFDDPAVVPFLTLVIVWMPFQMLANIFMSYLQIRTRSVAYVAISIGLLISLLLLSVLLLVYFELGVRGALWASLLPIGILGIVGTVYLFSWAGFRPSWPVFKGMLRFGLPYLPAAVLMYVISNADRYFLIRYASVDSVGLYALASKIGMVGTMLLMEPFMKVWSPFLFQTHMKSDGPRLIADVFRLFTVVSVYFALLVSVAAPIVVPFISSEEFHLIWVYVPAICLASVFYGIHHIADAGILISKRTNYKPLIFGIGAATAVATNGLLVPSLGIVGACIAAVVTYAVLLFVTYVIAGRYYNIPVDMLRVFATFLIGGLCYGLSLAIRWILPDNLGLLFSLVTLAIFPVLIWYAGILLEEERSSAWSYSRSLIARLSN